MIYFAMALFALSAVLGLSILIKWLTSKDASKGVIYSHGIVSGFALLLLVAYIIQNPDHFPMAALILFVLAALAGFYMFIRDLYKKMSPMAVAYIHAGLAVAGFVSLLIFVFV